LSYEVEKEEKEEPQPASAVVEKEEVGDEETED